MKDARFSNIGDAVKHNRSEIDERFKTKLDDIRHEWSRGDNGIRRSRLYFEDTDGYYLVITIEPIVDPKDINSTASSCDIPSSNDFGPEFPSPAHLILNEIEDCISTIRKSPSPSAADLLSQRMERLVSSFRYIVETETQYPRVAPLSVQVYRDGESS